MVTKMYCVYDAKTNVYGPPFFAHNDGHAVRMLSDDVTEGKSLIARHPEDYSLWVVGSFDDNKGVVESVPASRVIECQELKGSNHE